MPVVATLELDQRIATGIAASEADGAHGRLGAGIHHAHLIHRRNRLTDEFGELRLERCRRAVTQTPCGSRLHRLDDIGVSVTENHRSPGTHVVDVTLAVRAVQKRALGMIDKHRGSANGLERANRGIHPARYHRAGAFKKKIVVAHANSPYLKLGKSKVLSSRRPGLRPLG